MSDMLPHHQRAAVLLLNSQRHGTEEEEATYRASEGNGNKFGVKLIHMFGVQIYISKQLVLPLFTIIR